LAKRSIARTVRNLFVGGIGGALLLLALLIILLREYPWQALGLCLVAIGAHQYWNRWQHTKRASELERATRCADEQIQRHRNALIAYYRQSVRRDQFGNEDARAWVKWIGTFIDTQVRPELAKLQIDLDNELFLHINKRVDRQVRNIAEYDEPADLSESSFDKVTPEQYERDCAAILFRRGWSVRPTPTTGDHGADVVAEKGDVRLVVQCKLYSQPVGNKAVQEAYSACRLYAGTHSCVVAPKGFTAQAERAAHGLSVRLLHHSQLEAFADELSGNLTYRGNLGTLSS
jgi:restriction system protein